MKLKVGKSYSRQEISNLLGGSNRTYLPIKDGQVVCGCFKPTPEENPGAPEVVVIGRVDRREPFVISKQKTPIPVFLFRDYGAWEYVGRYRCTKFDRSPPVIQRIKKENAALDVIRGVLYFKRVSD